MPRKTTAKNEKETKRKRVVSKPTLSPETEGTFYKVFKEETFRNKPILVSPSILGRFKLHYLLGKKTSANPEMLKVGFGIMIFRTLEEARNWGSERRVYKVRVGKVFEPPQKRLHRDVLECYRDKKGKSLFVDSKVSWRILVSRLLKNLDVVDSWPRGTVMTDWIIPVEEVK